MPDPAVQGGFGRQGQPTVIKQDAATLTVTRTTQMGEVTNVYKLDGSESKNTLNFQGQRDRAAFKATWESGALHVDTVDVDGNAVNLTMAMSLDPSGNLVVVSTRPDFQGAAARSPRRPLTRRRISGETNPHILRTTFVSAMGCSV